MSRDGAAQPASGPGSALSVPVVHPRSGEVLGATHAELEQLPSATLAEAHVALREREGELSKMRKEVEVELVRRLDMRDRKVAVMGGWEVSYEPRRSREWDADAVDEALVALVEMGAAVPGELAGLVESRRVVNRSQAQSLLRRLAGDARKTLEACFTWREGSRSVTVVRSRPLVPDEPER